MSLVKPAKKIPLHFVSGLQWTGKTTLIEELLQLSAGTCRLGVIQSVRGQGALSSSQHPMHNIELIRSVSCVCCEIFILFYASLLVLLKDPNLDRIFIELGPEAEIKKLTEMLKGSPLAELLEFSESIITFDPRDFRFKPYSALPMVNRLIEDADIFVMKFADLAKSSDLDRFFSWSHSYHQRDKVYIVQGRSDASHALWECLQSVSRDIREMTVDQQKAFRPKIQS